MKRIAIGSDHAGYELKERLKPILEEEGCQVEDCGCHGTESVDYPDFGAAVGLAVTAGRADLGVLICGTGIGISIAANKVKGVRAALCHNTFTAEMARAHNDANVLCMGSRVLDEETAVLVLRRFLNSAFEGGRHQRRVDKIHDIETDGLEA